MTVFWRDRGARVASGRIERNGERRAVSLTSALRDELAHLPVRGGAERRVETAAIVRFGGTLRLRGGSPSTVEVVVRCAHGSVARRLRAALVEEFDHKPVIAQTRGGNLVGSSAYLVEIGASPLRALGVLDLGGRPRPAAPRDDDGHPLAYLAGAAMVAGRLSGEGQPVHFEVAAPSAATASVLAGMFDQTATGDRVVIKHGERVGDLLVGMGAHRTFLTFDAGRMRRELRGTVTRRVNADRANLRRTAETAAESIGRIQQLIDAVGWDGLPESLREVALVRIANPEGTLTELGELLVEPVAKATVHRRLARLDELARQEAKS